VAHDAKRWNAFICYVDGQKTAESDAAEALAYVVDKRVVAVRPADAEAGVELTADGFVARARIRDEGGAEWRLERRFRAAGGAVRIESALQVSAGRDVIHLPWLTPFRGRGHVWRAQGPGPPARRGIP
jgi:hypothetical protein